MSVFDHQEYGYTPPALTGRIRRQQLARELYTLREGEDAAMILAIRRSLRGRVES
jgi:hypothetical protein